MEDYGKDKVKTAIFGREAVYWKNNLKNTNICDRIYLGEFETFLTQPNVGKKTKLKEKK